MSNPTIGNNTQGSSSTNQKKLDLAGLFQNFLEHSMTLLYATVGLGFLLGALLTLALLFWRTTSYLLDIPALAAQSNMESREVIAEIFIDFVSGLLFILVILGILSTIVNYLKNRMTSLRPFLYTGIVAATRGILSVGLRLSLERENPEAFTRAMIELGVNTGIILILGITIVLISRLCEAPTLDH